MNENKKGYKSAYRKLLDNNISEESIRRINDRKKLFGDYRELSLLTPTIREAAMKFALSEDFEKFRPIAIERSPEQEKIQRLLNKNNPSLCIKEAIESFEVSKNTEK